MMSRLALCAIIALLALCAAPYRVEAIHANVHAKLQESLTAYSLSSVNVTEYTHNLPALDITAAKTLTYTLDIAGEAVTFDVHPHTDLFHVDYKHAILDEENTLRVQESTANDCFYKGSLGGNPVHLSTCRHGLAHPQGWLTHGTEKYHFDSLITHTESLPRGLHMNLMTSKPSESFDHTHVVYKAQDVTTLGEATCGVQHTELELEVKTQVDRALFAAGECDGSATKYVEIVLVNDYSFYEAHGDAVETVTAEIFAVVADIYANTDFACSFELKLLGQLTLRNGDPDAIDIRSCDTVSPFLMDLVAAGQTLADGDACCLQACNCGYPLPDNAPCIQSNLVGDLTQVGCYMVQLGAGICGNLTRVDYYVELIESTDPDEIDVSNFLYSFLDWWYIDMAENVTEIFGQVDNVHLFSALDFSGTTVGLASNPGVCSGQAGGVNMLVGTTVAHNAEIYAHELGHNFGMIHDCARASDCPTYIMSPALTYPPQTEFSPESIGLVDAFMLNEYGTNQSSGTPDTGKGRCLDAPSGQQEDWTDDRCGNGIVEAEEECDPGFEEDSCCTEGCMLVPGCDCANTEPCCFEGDFVAVDTPCRTAKHPVCDFAEVCSGTSGSCPYDLYPSSGTTCTIEEEVAEQNMVYTGQCFRGTCRSLGEQCGSHFGETAPAASSDCQTVANVSECLQFWCEPSPNTNGNCHWSGSPPAAGSSCTRWNGLPGQCKEEVCVDMEQLRLYHVATDIWSWCVDDTQYRQVYCHDEVGVQVSPDLCGEQYTLTVNSRPVNHTYTTAGTVEWELRDCTVDTRVDGCLSAPCANGATCTTSADIVSFQCACVDGWEGHTCSDDVDDCLSVPCENEGVCSNGAEPNTFTCDCADIAFTGVHCETAFDACDSNPCQNNATLCYASGGRNIYCECTYGWSGDLCEIRLDYCADEQAACNNGTCFQNEENFVICTCPFGFTGSRCETAWDAPSTTYLASSSVLSSSSAPMVSDGSSSSSSSSNSITDDVDSNQTTQFYDLCIGFGPCQNDAECAIDSTDGFPFCDCVGDWLGQFCTINNEFGASATMVQINSVLVLALVVCTAYFAY